MITLNDVFNSQSLNIFTDASMNGYGTSGCTGICLVFGEIDRRFPLLNTQTHNQIIKGCTNNFAEAEAIREAVYAALMYKDKYPVIRIFSDSLICIDNLRKRIVTWKISKKNGVGEFIASGNVAKNQEIFTEIMYVMTENNMSIEFLHQMSHTNFTNSNSLENARNGFIKNNNIADEIDMELIRALSFYNNYVDRVSRDIFYSVDLMNIKKTIFPIKYHIDENYDRNVYAALVSRENSIFNRKIQEENNEN